MHHYNRFNMALIDNISDLRQVLSRQNMQMTSNFDEEFYRIAESLFKNFAIKVGDIEYRFVELEFYLNIKDETKGITYKRDTKAGEWLIHYSGFDLSFESSIKENFYGGILVRALTSSDYDTEKKNYINGPLRCLLQVFKGINALDSNNMTPQIIESKSIKAEEIKELVVCTRHGIDEKRSKSKYRYTIPLRMWPKDNSYKAYPADKIH